MKKLILGLLIPLVFAFADWGCNMPSVYDADSITTDHLVVNESAELNGYTKLGSDAPVIKMKKVTGTTGASEGSATTIAHGLTLSKIIGYHVLVDNVSGNKIPPAFTSIAEFEYDTFIDVNNVNIRLHATNSGSIKSKLTTVLITYEN